MYQRRAANSLNITVSILCPDVPLIYVPLAVPFPFICSFDRFPCLMLDNLSSPERNGGGKSHCHKLCLSPLYFLHTRHRRHPLTRYLMHFLSVLMNHSSTTSLFLSNNNKCPPSVSQAFFQPGHSWNAAARARAHRLTSAPALSCRYMQPLNPTGHENCWRTLTRIKVGSACLSGSDSPCTPIAEARTATQATKE